MHHLAVKRELLDGAMAMHQDSHSWTLIHTARLDAHVTILDQIDPSHAVPAAYFVGPLYEPGGREPFAVDRNRIAAIELDLNILRLIRGVFGCDRHLEDIIVWLRPWVLQNATLITDMDQVSIGRVWLLGRNRHRNLLFGGISDHVGAPGEWPVR